MADLSKCAVFAITITARLSYCTLD